GDLLLAALAVLAGTVGAGVDRALRAAPEVLAHTPVDLVLRRMRLRDAWPFNSRRAPAAPRWNGDLNGGARVTRHASRRRARPAAEGAGYWRQRPRMSRIA